MDPTDRPVDPAARLVDAGGKPTRTKDAHCPRCGSGRRVVSGFGRAHPVCRDCGYDFVGERWEG